MRVVVIYQSLTGNTRKLAEAICDSLNEEDIAIYSITDLTCLPEADLYFCGFAIHNQNCSIQVSRILEQMKGKNFALFYTCGFCPTSIYKKCLRKNLGIWLPTEGNLIGSYVCQGKVDISVRNLLIEKRPREVDHLLDMFSEGVGHPNETDIRCVKEFARFVIEEVRDVD